MKASLNGNALKIIAMITMLCDHFGMIFFPYIDIFRIIGRISFPIYAFLIAEGCKYTHNRKKYFLQIFILGLICSIVFIIAERYVYLCVLITFSMSILLIYLLDYVKDNPKKRFLLLIVGLVISYEICNLVEVDYGFVGVLVPVMVYLTDNRVLKIVLFTISLIFLSLINNNGVQIYCLISVIFIILYNGQRGKLNLKKFFYMFYPMHLAILWGVAMLLDINV